MSIPANLVLTSNTKNEYLQFCSLLEQNSAINEIEFRVNSGVTEIQFNNLLERLKIGNELQILKYEVEISGNNCRKITTENGTVRYEDKARAQNLIFNFHNIDVKLSASIETEINDRVWNPASTVLKRKIERYNITTKSAGRIWCLSKVNLNDYEIELEINSNNKIAEELCYLLTNLFPEQKCFIEKPIASEIIEKFNAKIEPLFATTSNRAAAIVNKKNIIALVYEARLINLKPYHLSSRKFAITPKFDGVTRYLFVAQIESAIYIWLIYKTAIDLIYKVNSSATKIWSLLSPYIGTILQGEYMEKQFWVFDTMYLGNELCIEMYHSKRLCKAEQFVNRFSQHWLKIKPHFHTEISTMFNIRDCLRYMHNTWEHDSEKYCDGLVFVPLDTSFRNDATYKWKFPQKMTIDFAVYVKYEDEFAIKWSLHVTASDGSLIEFEYNKSNYYLITRHYNNIVSGAIVECKWNGESFDIYRVRFEKNKPNYVAVAQDVMHDILNPVTVTNLLNVESETLELKLFRNYHNEIKKNLIADYCNNKQVLDIGFGRGGDIHKYIAANTMKVHAVEPNYEYLKIATQRIRNIKNTQQFILHNLYGQDATPSNLGCVPNKFDTVIMMFSINFFNEALFAKLLDAVASNIKSYGYFIITFMDWNLVCKLLEGQAKFSNNVGCISTMAESGKIQIHLGGTTMVQAQEEYQISATYIENELKKIKFKKIKDFIFDDMDKIRHLNASIMANADSVQKFSSMYRAQVYQKMPNFQIKYVKTPEQVDEISAKKTRQAAKTSFKSIATFQFTFEDLAKYGNFCLKISPSYVTPTSLNIQKQLRNWFNTMNIRPRLISKLVGLVKDKPPSDIEEYIKNVKNNIQIHFSGSSELVISKYFTFDAPDAKYFEDFANSLKDEDKQTLYELFH